MSLQIRPFTPPSLQALIANEDGTAAARLLSDERIRAVAEAAGRREGFAEGLAQGRAESLASARATASREAQEEMARRGLQGAAAAAEALQTLFAWREADRRGLDADLRAALVAALQVVLPGLLARAAGGEVAALLAQALTERAADTITLRAHPTTLAEMQREGCPAPVQAGRLRLLPDDSIAPGHAEAAWVDGGLLYDPQALVTQVLAVLGGGAAPPQPAPAPKPANPEPAPAVAQEAPLSAATVAAAANPAPRAAARPVPGALSAPAPSGAAPDTLAAGPVLRAKILPPEPGTAPAGPDAAGRGPVETPA
jgi:flagellar biosynthesis/type III secretory pathway protein FliH